MNIPKRNAGLQPCVSSNTQSINNATKPTTLKTQRQGVPRDRLPSPHYYYTKQFPGLQASGEWVNVRCSFHADSNPSLSLNLVSGGFFCHACGAKGGDVIAFHRQRFDLGFSDAVLQLVSIRLGEPK